LSYERVFIYTISKNV